MANPDPGRNATATAAHHAQYPFDHAAPQGWYAQNSIFKVHDLACHAGSVSNSTNSHGCDWLLFLYVYAGLAGVLTASGLLYLVSLGIEWLWRHFRWGFRRGWRELKSKRSREKWRKLEDIELGLRNRERGAGEGVFVPRAPALPFWQHSPVPVMFPTAEEEAKMKKGFDERVRKTGDEHVVLDTVNWVWEKVRGREGKGKGKDKGKEVDTGTSSAVGSSGF